MPCRSVTREAVKRLQSEIQQKAGVASKHLIDIAASAAATAEAEVAAAGRLREITNAKSHTACISLIQQLEIAIAEAAKYDRLQVPTGHAQEAVSRIPEAALWDRDRTLQAELADARQLLKHWEARSRALSRLDEEVAVAKQPLEPPPAGSDASRRAFWTAFQGRLDRLGSAIAAAQTVDLSVSRPKRVQHEMQAQLAAEDAAQKLEALLASKPCGSAALRVSLREESMRFASPCQQTGEGVLLCQVRVQRAEAAASAAASSVASGHCEGLRALQPVLQTAKRQLEIERAAELLQRAVSTSQTLADLPKLEAAILAARKTGDIDPSVLK